MRRSIGTVGIAILVLLPVAAVAQTGEGAPPPGCKYDRLIEDYACDGETVSGGGGGGGTGGSNVTTTTLGYNLLWVPDLRPGPDGRCIDSTMEDLGREPTQDEQLQSELQFFRFLQGGNPVCPDAEIPPGTTPPLEAARFLQRIDLPLPTPEVRPGRLPVGLDSYLEIGSPTERTYGPEPTPFGDLTLTATAEVFVDWDDPHDDVDGEEGPYRIDLGDGVSRPAVPGPHPTGEITHLYQHDGFYEISVRLEWTATWSIGTEYSGTILGAETTGTYPAPGFEAFSRQAVG